MKANNIKAPESGDGFSQTFPTSTARNGRVRRNSIKDGRGQGRGSSKKFVHCKQCGFVFDRNKTDRSGGVYSGEGGLSGVTLDSQTVVLLNGQTANPAQFGTQTVPPGGGCPNCGSKNSVANSGRG